MSKTHKITQLKKRIAELERMLKEIPSLQDRFDIQPNREIVVLENTLRISASQMRFKPTDEDIVQRAIRDMFDLYEHPELINLFTCTEYISRIDPMYPDTDTHFFDVRCEILKPTQQ